MAALRRVCGDGKLVGIRPMEGVSRGPDWLNAPAFAGGIDAIAASGLVFEALLLPHHLPGLLAIARQHSEMPIIINHAAKPTSETFEAWVTDLEPFGALDNVSCKLSGLTAQSMDADFHTRVFDTLVEVFGMDRLIWGSDYPVLLESVRYQTWVDTTFRLLDGLDSGERDAVLTRNASHLYGLKQGQNHAQT